MSGLDPNININGCKNGPQDSTVNSTHSSQEGTGDTAEQLAKYLDKIKNDIAVLRQQVLGPEQDKTKDKSVTNVTGNSSVGLA